MSAAKNSPNKTTKNNAPKTSDAILIDNTAKSMPLKPRMSEKAYGTSLAINTYVFNVPINANKMTVAAAVEAQFGVTVEGVQIIVSKGKAKSSYQKRNRPVSGMRAKQKKAYVRLVEGNSINIFGEEEKADKQTEKSAKATDKKEKK